MHSLTNVDHKEDKKAKGVNKGIVKNIGHDECLNALFNKKMMSHKMRRIQSKLKFVKYLYLVLMIEDVY